MNHAASGTNPDLKAMPADLESLSAPARERFSDAMSTPRKPDQRHDVDEVPVEITLFEKPDGILSKMIALKDGQIIADGSACYLNRGTMRRLRFSGVSEFAVLIGSMPSNQAIALGRLADGLPDEAPVVTKEAVAWAAPGSLTRTQDNIAYPAGQPALALQDYDRKGAPKDVLDRIAAKGGFYEALLSIVPQLAQTARVRRASTSSGLYNVETRESYAGSGGEHLFVVACDGSDIPRYLRTLHDRCWLHGYGWHVIGRAGQLLERAIVDRSVTDPARLVFEGAPSVIPPLAQSPRPAEVFPGTPLDTRAACPDLTPEEVIEVERLKAASRQRLKPESEKAQRAFVEKKTKELVDRGVAPNRAKHVAERFIGERLGGELLPEIELELDDGRVVTVAKILADPNRFAGTTLPDPVEGREYGPNKAIVMRDGDAIWSWAHGGDVIYRLRYDFESARKLIEAPPKGEATTTLVDLHLKLSETVTKTQREQLVAIAAKRDGVGMKPVRADLEAAEQARKEKQAKKTPPTDKPQIIVRTGMMHVTAAEADAALAVSATRLNVYRRGHDIVRPTKVKLAASDGREIYACGLKPFKMADLRLVLADAADFYAYNAKEQLCRIDPPRDLVGGLLAASDGSKLPEIAGVITCPTLRPDGSVLREPGYDPATSIYHFADGRIDLSGMKAAPDRDDALKALALLEGLFEEFPFVDLIDKAVAISALLTVVMRPMFELVPGHAWDAPTAGTGKSFLADIISYIVSGEACPVIAACKNEGETEKALSAALLSGQSLISLDNLVEPMEGGLLCQAVTQKIIDIRPFGQNKENKRVVNRVSVLANGNNLQIVDDQTRRFLVGRLDARVERPELRTFAHNPKAMILENRGDYVAACLTIVGAYIAAGRPGRLPPLGSFQQWSNTIRSALFWLGRPDVVDTLEAARANDPNRAKSEAFRAALVSYYGLGKAYAITASEMSKDASSTGPASDEHRQLIDAVDAIVPGGKKSSNALGCWLRQEKGRIVDGQVLDSVIDSHTKVARWFVASVDEHGRTTGEERRGAKRRPPEDD